MRDAGATASRLHGKASTATVRAELIQIPARVARSSGQQIFHLPANWPWANAATALFDTLHTAPIAT